jgi:hypothetical protein
METQSFDPVTKLSEFLELYYDQSEDTQKEMLEETKLFFKKTEELFEVNNKNIEELTDKIQLVNTIDPRLSFKVLQKIKPSQEKDYLIFSIADALENINPKKAQKCYAMSSSQLSNTSSTVGVAGHNYDSSIGEANSEDKVLNEDSVLAKIQERINNELTGTESVYFFSFCQDIRSALKNHIHLFLLTHNFDQSVMLSQKTLKDIVIDNLNLAYSKLHLDFFAFEIPSKLATEAGRKEILNLLTTG